MALPTRRLLPLCLLLLVATSRCSCLTATTSTGTCEGRIGDVDISGELDVESEHHTLYRDEVGNAREWTVLNLSCAKGLLKVSGTLEALSDFGDSFSLPGSDVPRCPPPQDGGTADAGSPDAGGADAGVTGICIPGGDLPAGTYPVRTWKIIPERAAPQLIAGLLTVLRKLDGSLDGTVTMEFSDGSRVRIRYNAYHETSLDVGSPPSSGGGRPDSDSD